MKRYIIFFILLIFLVGCGEEEGPVTIEDDSVVTSMLNGLDIRMYIENHTKLPIMAEFDVEFHDNWIEDQIKGEPEVYERYHETTGAPYRLDHRSENLYSISYDFEKKVDRIQFIKAIDQGAVEVIVTSEEGEELARNVITNVEVYDIDSPPQSKFMVFLTIIASIVIAGFLFDKFIRKWTGIAKPDREDLPKLHKTLSTVLNIGSGLYITFALGVISPTKLWENIILMVILYGLLQVLLDYLLIKHQKEYRVTLLQFTMFLIIVVIMAEQYPYVFF